MSAPPAEFGGPGYRWSPETLLIGAVADCFVLTFRTIAKGSRLRWTEIICEATGKLDRVDRVTRFTEIELHVTLSLPAGEDTERARALLARTEKVCLISNSLQLEVTLHADVRTETAIPAETVPYT
jgi:organic hydroperoxide reductase OsmC/OhrA